jgi:peptide/nickel transport system permease protein
VALGACRSAMRAPPALLRYGLARLAGSLLLLWVILTFTFVLIHATPGEPVWIHNPALSPEAIERLRDLYGVSRPMPLQYLHWLGAVVRGDWGISFSSSRPAMAMVLERVPATMTLVFSVLLLEHLAGIGLGWWAAKRAGTRVDRALRALALLANAAPVFVIGPLLIEVLAIRWPLLPPQQMSSLGAETWPWPSRLGDLLHHLFLPAFTYACVRFGGVFRHVRNGLLDVLASDHIRMARAMGIGERRIFWRFALPHTFTPLIQRFGVALPMMLSSSMIIEAIFSWPGFGWLFYNAVFQRDYPVLLAATAFSAVMVMLGSWLADLLAAMLDPRLRHVAT